MSYRSLKQGCGRMVVQSKLQVPGRLTIWMIVGQGHTALVERANEGCLLSSILILLFSLSLRDTRYRHKYCLKGPLNPKQPTTKANDGLDKLSLDNQSSLFMVHFPVVLLTVRSGGSVVYQTLDYKSTDRKIDPQLLRSSGGDFKPRSRLRMTSLLARR